MNMNTAKRFRMYIGLLAVLMVASLSFLFGGGVIADDSTDLPARATGLDVSTQEGSLSASLDWDDVSGATYYLVRWRVPTPEHNLNEGIQVQSSDAVITVEDYGEWVVRVQACNDAGCGPRVSQKFTIVLAKPTGLTVSTRPGQLTVTVDWDDTPGATGYKVYWRLAGPGNRLKGGIPVRVSDVAMTFKEYREWVVRVEACNDTGCGQGAIKKFRIVLAAPTGLAAATQLDSLDVSLNWDAVDGATSYKLRWRKSGDANFEASNAKTASDTSAAITVSGYDRWEVQAQACNDSGCGQFASHSFATSETLPAPTGLAATTQLDSLDVSLNWDAVDGATSYKLRWRKSGDANFEASNAKTASDTSAAITVSGYDEWEVQAQACNDAGCSQFASHSFQTQESLPAPTGLAAATQLDSLDVSLNWDAVDGATSYKLRWRKSGDVNFEASNAKTASDTSAAITVSGYDRWEVQAQACNDAGCSQFASHSFATSETLPAPTGLAAATQLDSLDVSLNWDAVDGATSYKLRWRKSGDVNFEASNAKTASDTSAAITVSGYDRWEVQAQACNDAGCSQFASHSFQTQESLPAPTGLAAATQLDSLDVSLNWDAVDGATSYKLRWRKSGDVNFEASNAKTASDTTAAIAVSGYDRWEVQAQACNDAGCGQFASHFFQTQESLPPPFGLAATTQLDSLDVSLSWDAVDGATSYKLRWRQADAENFRSPDAKTASDTTAAITVSGFDRWQVQAQACNDAGCGQFASHSFQTQESLPAPTGLAATTQLDSLDVSLNWDAVNGATSYKLRWRKSGDANFEASNAKTASDTTAAIAVSGYDRWEVQAQACNDAGCSQFASHSFQTQESLPAPTGLAAATQLDSLDVSLNWDAVNGATSYKLRWRKSGDVNFEADNAAAASTTSAAITVSGYDRWEVQAQACNDAGCGQFASHSFATSETLPAPTGLAAATQLDSLDVSLNWDAVNGATYYELTWIKVDGTSHEDWTKTVSTTSAVITVSDYYWWQVQAQACNDSGCGQFASHFFQTQESLPAPTGLAAATQLDSLDVSLSWDAVDGATSYKLRWRQADAENFEASNAKTASTTSAAITVSGFDEWEVQAQTCNDTRCGSFASHSFATSESLPAPTGLNAAGQFASYDVSVNWDAVDDATSYKLRWRQAEAASFRSPDAKTVSDNTAAITVQGYSRWEVQVQACNDAGCGQFASHSFQNGVVITTELDSLDVSLSWDAADGATYYELTWIKFDGTSHEDWTKTVSGTSAVITVSDYYWWQVQVQGCNDSGCNQDGRVLDLFETRESLPPPTGLAATTQLDSLDVSVNWDAVDGATSYKLRWRQADAENFEADNAATASTTSAAITVSGFDEWEVQAQTCNDTRCGSFASHSFATSEPLPAPTGLKATAQFYSLDVSLSWDAVDGATSYKLRWRQADAENFEADNAATASTTSAAITVSGGYDRWEVQVQACNDAGCGEFASHSFQNGLVITTELGSLDVSVSWNAADGATYYRLYWYDYYDLTLREDWTKTVSGTSAVITVSDYGKWGVTIQPCNDSDGCNGGIGNSFETRESLPAAPTGIITGVRLAGSLEVFSSWDAVDGATSYKLRWRQADAENFRASDTKTVSDTGAAITASGYGKWEVQVQACHGLGCGPFASTTVETRDLSQLPPPNERLTGVTVRSIYDAVVLSWPKIDDPRLVDYSYGYWQPDGVDFEDRSGKSGWVNSSDAPTGFVLPLPSGQYKLAIRARYYYEVRGTEKYVGSYYPVTLTATPFGRPSHDAKRPGGSHWGPYGFDGRLAWAWQDVGYQQEWVYSSRYRTWDDETRTWSGFTSWEEFTPERWKPPYRDPGEEDWMFQYDMTGLTNGTAYDVDFKIDFGGEEIIYDDSPINRPYLESIIEMHEIPGSEGDDYLYAPFGDDELREVSGLGGDDIIIGRNNSRTVMNGGGGDDVLLLLQRNPTFANRVDNVYYELNGGDGDDKLASFIGGRIFLNGGPGNDILSLSKAPAYGSGVRYRYTGGEGDDLVTYAGATKGVEARLSYYELNPSERDRPSRHVDITGVENLFGSLYDDHLFGDDNANTLNGSAGSDELTGGGGADNFIFFFHEFDFGDDTITDFQLAATVAASDRLFLCPGEGVAMSAITVTAIDSGSDRVITIAVGGAQKGTITLKGITSSSDNFANLRIDIPDGTRATCEYSLTPPPGPTNVTRENTGDESYATIWDAPDTSITGYQSVNVDHPVYSSYISSINMEDLNLDTPGSVKQISNNSGKLASTIHMRAVRDYVIPGVVTIIPGGHKVAISPSTPRGLRVKAGDTTATLRWSWPSTSWPPINNENVSNYQYRVWEGDNQVVGWTDIRKRIPLTLR